MRRRNIELARVDGVKVCSSLGEDRLKPERQQTVRRSAGAETVNFRELEGLARPIQLVV